MVLLDILYSRYHINFENLDNTLKRDFIGFSYIQDIIKTNYGNFPFQIVSKL